MTDTFQWQRCDASDPGDGSTCADVGGATSSTYLLAAADVGHRVRLTAARDGVAVTPSSMTSEVVPAGTPRNMRFGITNNVSGDLSNGQAVLDIGAKLIREDTAAANAWAASHGIDVIQIIYPGDTPASTSYAHEVVANSRNEPYWGGVNPSAWAVAAYAEVQRVRNLNLGKPIIIPLVSYGARAGNNGMDGIDYPGQYAYPNGGTPYMVGHASWVHTINSAAPDLLSAVDGFSVHPYFNDPAFHVLDVVRAELTALGHAQPFWITEDGQYDTGTPASESTASSLIQQNVSAAQARADVNCFILYRLGEAFEGSAHWGILRSNGTQKPAYAPYKAAIATSP